MKAKRKGPEQDDLFRARLVEIIDMRYELVKLAALIDWEFFKSEWAGVFPSKAGRPATPPRIVAGLLYLQHAYGNRLSNTHKARVVTGIQEVRSITTRDYVQTVKS